MTEGMSAANHKVLHCRGVQLDCNRAAAGTLWLVVIVVCLTSQLTDNYTV